MSIVFISEFSPHERKSDFLHGVGKINPGKDEIWDALPPKPKANISQVNEKAGLS